MTSTAPLPLLASLLVAALVLGACVGAPIQEISDARQALRVADQAEAPRHVPANYEQAQALLDEATRDLYAGRYDEARTAALAAREKAMQARRVAEAIGRAQAAVDAAKANDEPWEEADRLVQQARASAASGEIEPALELAEAAQRLAGGTPPDPP